MSEQTPESEITFLRSQVSLLSSRLCETLTQQVAQQQTVLIASMQTNLALTQTVDRLNKLAENMAEQLEREEEEEETPAPSADFGSILSMLAPYLLSAANPNPKAPPPAIVLPKAVTDLMRKRGPQAVQPVNPAPGAAAPTGKESAKKKNPKEK